MRSSFILALTCAIAVPAACTAGDDHDSSETTQPTTVASNLDPDRPAPAPDLDGATPGGVVTVLSASPLATMDPSEAYAPQTVSILAGLVTRSLTQWVYDPDRDTMVLVPDIATDLGTHNNDYTEWTYTVRPGVKFEDGTEVTADDVAFGIERSFDRTTFPTGPTWSNDYFLHGDTYKGPYLTGTYDGIEVDSDTLTLTMAKPFPDMPYWGALPAIGPIPRLSDPRTYAQHPMATGPYRFADYHPRSLTLVRNEEWDPNTDPGRHAYPDGYTFEVADFAEIGRTLLSDSGDARTTMTSEELFPTVLRRAMAAFPERVTTGPAPCVHTISLDTRRIPDVRVRKAIGYAFPYDDFLSAEQELDGVTNIPARTLLPVGTPGRREFNPLSTNPGATDPDKAVALLAEAGYSTGDFSLTFAYNSNDRYSVATRDALVAGFEAGGFAVDPYKTSSNEEQSAVQEDSDSPVNLRFGGWCSDWPSGNASILPFFSSTAPTNFDTYFQDHDIDAAIERIDELPLDDQPAAWGALDEKIETEYYPILVTDHGLDAMLHGSRIGGMNDDTAFSMPTWKDLFVLS